jgi:uncharacterized protein YbgA (DUF1722 family)
MNSGNKSVYDEQAAYAFFTSISVPVLRPAFVQCVTSIFFNFFFRQYRAALLPGVPVSKVDHPLDEKIPFVPSWVTIYLDFVQFWVRMLSFLLRRYGRPVFGKVREFITGMGRLYAFAAEVYKKNFSTTMRPFYIARPRFFLIHLVDPHLMCIPSLHVMVVIRTYTWFRSLIQSLGEGEALAQQIEELRQGALAIAQAILFVKQHSVNCVAAALYAMTCFDAALFPVEEAETFTALLFGEPPAAPANARRRLHNYQVRPIASPHTPLSPADAAEIRAHILGLYRRFLAERESAANWAEPLLAFLRTQPLVQAH